MRHGQEGRPPRPACLTVPPGRQVVRVEVTSEFGTHAWRWL